MFDYFPPKIWIVNVKGFEGILFPVFHLFEGHELLDFAHFDDGVVVGGVGIALCLDEVDTFESG